jgi:hypothetical protein
MCGVGWVWCDLLGFLEGFAGGFDIGVGVGVDVWFVCDEGDMVSFFLQAECDEKRVLGLLRMFLLSEAQSVGDESSRSRRAKLLAGLSSAFLALSPRAQMWGNNHDVTQAACQCL